MPFLRKVLMSSGLGLAGALALSGCEIGNKSTTELKGYDTISGYYASLPQTISFQAQIGNGAVRNQAATVTHMPAFLKAVMSNPTMLFFDNPLTGDASLRAHTDTSIGIATKVEDRLGTFGASSVASAIVSGCKLQEEIVHSGAFTQSGTTFAVGSLLARGHLSLDYHLNYSLIGDDVDCDAMRATFKSCYVDGVGCSTNSGSIFYRAFVQQIFGPLIDAGVMTETEIATARSVGYHATYQ